MTIRSSRLLPIASVAIILVVGGCRSRTQSDIAACQRTFSTVIYVGQTTGTGGYPGVGEHGSQLQPFPERLLPGRQYVFHRRRSTTDSWTELKGAPSFERCIHYRGTAQQQGLGSHLYRRTLVCDPLQSWGTKRCCSELPGGRTETWRLKQRSSRRGLRNDHRMSAGVSIPLFAG